MKKILALLLTVGMVLGLFAGCGNSNTPPAGTAAASEMATVAAARMTLLPNQVRMSSPVKTAR